MMSSVAAFEDAIPVKSMYIIKSSLKPDKKRKHGNQINFYINLYLKYGRIHSLLRREGALKSFTVCNAYRYFVGKI